MSTSVFLTRIPHHLHRTRRGVGCPAWTISSRSVHGISSSSSRGIWKSVMQIWTTMGQKICVKRVLRLLSAVGISWSRQVFLDFRCAIILSASFCRWHTHSTRIGQSSSSLKPSSLRSSKLPLQPAHSMYTPFPPTLTLWMTPQVPPNLSCTHSVCQGTNQCFMLLPLSSALP